MPSITISKIISSKGILTNSNNKYIIIIAVLAIIAIFIITIA